MATLSLFDLISSGSARLRSPSLAPVWKKTANGAPLPLHLGSPDPSSGGEGTWETGRFQMMLTCQNVIVWLNRISGRGVVEANPLESEKYVEVRGPFAPSFLASPCCFLYLDDACIN